MAVDLPHLDEMYLCFEGQFSSLQWQAGASVDLFFQLPLFF
jgi:hypothetical protein